MMAFLLLFFLSLYFILLLLFFLVDFLYVEKLRLYVDPNLNPIITNPSLIMWPLVISIYLGAYSRKTSLATHLPLIQSMTVGTYHYVMQGGVPIPLKLLEASTTLRAIKSTH